MERMTQVSKEKIAYLPNHLLSQREETYIGVAVDRLAAFETMVEAILAEQQTITESLDQLRVQGKKNTARFREQLGQKLVNDSILARLQVFGIQ